MNEVAHRAVPSERRIPELDGLRGIAVSMVLVWHFLGVMLAPELGYWAKALRHVLIFGRTGVDLFFVLSGFLIIGILVDQRQSSSLFSTFYARRSLRILPPYLMLFLAFWITVIVGVQNSVFGNQIPFWSHLTFTQNWIMALQNSYGPGGFSVTWSVAIEEQFYLLFPLIIILTPPRRLHFTLIALAVISASVRMLVYLLDPHNSFSPYVLTPCRLDALCAGGLIALLWRNDSCIRKLKSSRRMVTKRLLFFASGILFLLLAIVRDIDWHMYVWGHTYLTLLYGLALLVVLLSVDEQYSVGLRNRLLRGMGRLSYGLYLFHPLILGSVFLVAGRPAGIASLFDALLALFAFATTIFICWVSYRFIEAPCIRLGARFRYESATISPKLDICINEDLAKRHH
jgi:peptidoglycan/LPS O-acetylase OafA/YrhL